MYHFFEHDAEVVLIFKKMYAQSCTVILLAQSEVKICCEDRRQPHNGSVDQRYRERFKEQADCKGWASNMLNIDHHCLTPGIADHRVHC
ncbi:hypothetical protein VTO73DRAFT_212 [Trametes versicolor]